MKRTLFAAASIALAASMPLLPASTALAKGTSQGPPRGTVECETGPFVTICWAPTRSDCAHAVGDYIKANGIRSIFAPNCERLLDGRWMFLLPL